MGENNQKLLENFPHIRVLIKAAAYYFGILGIITTLKDVWKFADDLRAWFYREEYAVPLLGIAFYALFLVVECIHRSQRKEMESHRSSPLLNRQMRRAAESKRLREQGRKK